jgi:uncharacterized protein YjbI with pentapeptide repeats
MKTSSDWSVTRPAAGALSGRELVARSVRPPSPGLSPGGDESDGADRAPGSRGVAGGFLPAGAELKLADLTGANLVRADLSGCRAEAAEFSGATLGGANLSSLDAPEALFNGADLAGARLVDARLAGAEFDAAQVIDADFSGATLTDASFTGAQGARVRMAGARLARLRAAEADFSDGIFTGCRAPESLRALHGPRGHDRMTSLRGPRRPACTGRGSPRHAPGPPARVRLTGDPLREPLPWDSGRPIWTRPTSAR